MAFTAQQIDQFEKDRRQVQTLTDAFYRDTKLSWRVRTILKHNPYMSTNVDAVMQMAQMPIPDNELVTQAGAIYGVQNADMLAKQLKRYGPSTQRAIFASLSPAQQQTLRQMGFEPSKKDIDEGNFLERLVDTAVEGVGDAAGFVVSGIGRKVMPVLGPALNLLDEASDFVVGRPYRTIRQLGTDGQLAALFGGLAGAVGVLAAPVTGGASLALTGLAVAGGAAAGSLTQQAFVGNADDWFNAWSAAGNGEKLFKNSGVQRATEILGDPRLVNMAKKFAETIDEDTSLINIARDVAGTENSLSPDVQQKQLAEIAKQFATEGSPEYKAVYKGLTELTSDPLFQDAVKVLEQSKISIGRDVAGGLGFDPDSDAYRWISGSVDAASLIIIDPFVVAGKTARMINMGRKGINTLDAAKAAERFLVLSQEASIKRSHEIFVDAINTGSTQLVKRYVPWLMPVWNDFLAHSRNPEFGGRLMKAEDYVDWVVGPNQLRSLMQGVGMVQGVSYGMLRGINKFQYAMRTSRGALADFMQGAADLNIETVLERLTKNPEALKQLVDELPAEWSTHLAGVTEDVFPEIMASLEASGAPTKLAQLAKSSAGIDPTSYELGRKFGRLPFVKTLGSLYTNLSTLSPRGRLIMLESSKAESVTDIDAFIDLFQVAGVPSYVREIWKRAIYDSPEVSTRLNLLTGLLDSVATATGMKATKAGSDVIDEFITKVREQYGIGSHGRFDLPVQGGRTLEDLPLMVLPSRDGAIMMQIPDLDTIRKAVRQGTLMRTLVGISDNVAIEAFQNKFWKPAVLLRFGFFVRNASEDLLAYVSRAGLGHMTQEWAARSIAQENVYMASLENVTPGFVQTGSRLGMPLDAPITGRLDSVLPPAERFVIAKDFLIPRHLRPVARIVERFGQEGSPALMQMADYGSWLRQNLREGFLPRGQRLGEVLKARATRAEMSGQRIRSNFYLNAELLAYGNRYSTRRMLFGGVDPELVRAAEAFQSKHMGAIMQRVGASSILPWQTESGTDQLAERFLSHVEGRKRNQYVRVSGERTFVKRNTRDSLVEEYHEAVWKSIAGMFDDAPTGRVMLEVAKVLPDEIGEAFSSGELFGILQTWGQTRRRISGRGESEILHLALILSEGNVNPERFQAFIQNAVGLGRAQMNKKGQLEVIDFFQQELIKRYPGQSMPSAEEFVDLWRSLISNVKSGNNPDLKALEFLRELEPVMNLVARLNEISNPVAKNWVVSNLYLDAMSQGTHFTNGVAGDTAYAGMLKNWERSQMREDAIFATGSRDNVYFSPEEIEDLYSEEYITFIREQGELDLSFNQWLEREKGIIFEAANQNLYGEPLYFDSVTASTPFPRQGELILPFYRRLEDALSAGKSTLIDEINTGQYDAILSLNRDYVPGAPGTKFYVVQTQPEVANLITDEMLVEIGILNPSPFAEPFDRLDGINYAFFENLFGISGLNPDEELAFMNFIDSYVRSLRQGQPMLVNSKAGADVLQQVNARILSRYFDYVAPPTKSTWLPVSNPDEISSLYPELPFRTLSVRTGLPGEPSISSVGWDTSVYPMPDTFLEEARKLTYPQTIVERTIENIRQNVRGGRRTKLAVRNNAEVYISVNGQPVRLEPGTYVDDYQQMYADEKLEKLVGTENQALFRSEDVTYEGNTEVMFGIVAPMLIDLAEDLSGTSVRAVKSWKTIRAPKIFADVGYTPGEVYDLPLDVIRVRASQVQDVFNTPVEDLPNWAIAQMYEAVDFHAWDRFVQYGFNNVLSPMLDAVARRPMAFHSFVNAHQRNSQSVQWLFRGTTEEQEVNQVISKITQASEYRNLPETMMPRLVESGRMVARVHNIAEVEYWSDAQILAYLRSMTDEEIANLPDAVNAAIKSGRLSMNKNKANALISFTQKNKDQIRAGFRASELNAWNFLDRIDGSFGEGVALSGGFIPDRQLFRDLKNKLLPPGDMRQFLFDNLDYNDWQTLQRAARLRNHAYEQANEYAAEYAIRDIMPYIDTHEVRSQFADWARGYLPFWYAEENFLKRWARIFTLEGPTGSLARARKLQLTAQGLKTMGVVREDPNGNSYFVYPGSELLAEAVSKIPKIGLLPITALLQTPTDRMIPGFNPQFGAPGFSPLIALPVEISTYLFPESSNVRNFQRNLFGDISVNQNIVDMIFPAQVAHTVKAIYEYTQPYESLGNERLQSAMFAAIAHLEAGGNGLPDDATSQQVDEFLRRVRNHARVIVISQAIAGWFTPGPAQSLQLPEGMSSLEWLTEGRISNPAEILSSTYYEMIREMGIEEGTQAFLERFPDGTVNDVLEPLAYTVSRTESVSGAPLPRSEDGIAFYQENKDVFDQYEFAGPWLMPQDQSKNGAKSQYAYDAGMIEGLRKTKTPAEFLKELKFREGSSIYFSARKAYLDEYARLKEEKKSGAMRDLRQHWESFAEYWKATHPIFADVLVASDARERRQNVIGEMRYLLKDPRFPKASHFTAMKVLMDSYDNFTIERSRLNLNKTASARGKVEFLKKQFEDWVTSFTENNPEVNSFWMTVLRPESGLD